MCHSDLHVSIRFIYHAVACVVCYVVAVMSSIPVVDATSTTVLSTPGDKPPSIYAIRPSFSNHILLVLALRPISFSRPYFALRADNLCSLRHLETHDERHKHKGPINTTRYTLTTRYSHTMRFTHKGPTRLNTRDTTTHHTAPATHD